jgi:hypothetical protein
MRYREKDEDERKSLDAPRGAKPTPGSGDASETTLKAAKPDADQAKFQLQEAPKRKKSTAGSKRNSRSGMTPPSLDTTIDKTSQSAPVSAHTGVLQEQHINATSSEAPSSALMPPNTASPRISSDYRIDDNIYSDSSKPATPEPPFLPKRGDSLQKSLQTMGALNRKEVGGVKSTTSALRDEPITRDSASPAAAPRGSLDNATTMNGGKVIGRPMESPVSKSSLDFPPRSKDRPSAGDSFNSPRAPPQPPTESQHKRGHKNASISSIRSDIGVGDGLASPGLPRHQGGSEMAVVDDASRNAGGGGDDGESFLRRVSKSVRHARSHSDRGSRNSREQNMKWPRTPLNGTHGTVPEDLSSPLMSSPDLRDESNWYKNELRKEREKVQELEKKLVEFEGAMEGRNSIKAMSKELREKRSTMVVLDAQKEIVFRELEVLTEHITASKRSKEPLDLSSLSNTVVREFADSLQKLKDSFTPQLEDLTEKKATLVEELDRLTAQRDKAMQEFEQLSMKNAQLAELNNNLVHQIQGLQKSGQSNEAVRAATGLGIYTHHHKEKSTASIDSREMRPSIAESHLTGTTLAQDEQDGGATILNAPRVVNIRKEQPKARTFNWKKGGTVAKGVTKGIKGAFSSNDSRRECSTPALVEGTPYGSMSQNGDLPTTNLPARGQIDPSRQGFGFFGQAKKPVGNASISRPGANGGLSSEEPQHPSSE